MFLWEIRNLEELENRYTTFIQNVSYVHFKVKIETAVYQEIFYYSVVFEKSISILFEL